MAHRAGDEVVATTRRYRPGRSCSRPISRRPTGAVRIIDCMPPRQTHPRVVRVVEGLRGTVAMSAVLHPAVRLREDQAVDPRIRHGGERRGRTRSDGASSRGPASRSTTSVSTPSSTVARGQRVGFVLTWYSSWEEPRPHRSMPSTPSPRPRRGGRAWSGRSTYRGGWEDEVERSLITLKALTYEPTGGIVAAADDLAPGVPRRRPELGLPVLLDPRRRAHARCADGRRLRRRGDQVAGLGDPRGRGRPEDLQIMYGVAGERRLDEYELAWLPGYEGSSPVRVGNAASGQLQLDVYGELTDAIYRARTARDGSGARCVRPGQRVCSGGSRSIGVIRTTASGRCEAPDASSSTRR